MNEAENEQHNTVSKEAIRLEYLEAGTYLRHYSALRFAMLTVYFAVIGGLSAVALGLTDTQTPHLDTSRWAALGAIIVTCVFYTFELLCEKFIRYFVRHVRGLEEKLGYTTLSQRPPSLKAVPIATAILYGSILLFWVYVLAVGS